MKPKRDEIDTSASTEVLRKLAQKHRDRNAVLEPRLDALEAELKALGGGLDDNASTLLEEIAQALFEAREVSNPIQAAVLNLSGVRTTGGNPIPGSSTYAPRKYANAFRETLWTALQTFEAAKGRNWQAEDQPLRAPMVRCHKRDCDAYGLSYPAWKDFRTGKRIYAERCTACGEMLSTEPVPTAIDTE